MVKGLRLLLSEGTYQAFKLTDKGFEKFDLVLEKETEVRFWRIWEGGPAISELPDQEATVLVAHNCGSDVVSSFDGDVFD